MQERLTARWYASDPRPSALQPLGWLYGAAMRLRRRGYEAGWLRAQRVAAAVIVVGNLTVGGTGKTPFTLWLAQQLAARALPVGILSRGYGRRGHAPRLVQPGADYREVGDEPLLLARRSGCPTVVARARAAGARRLLELGARVIVCDDGLQHLALARDCEIVVIDGARGLGNGRLLPAGPLREAPARLARADLLIVNGAPEHASLAGLAAGGTLLRMDLIGAQALRVDGTAVQQALADFRGARVHAVAGIGNPGRFFGALRAQGLQLIEHAFADHHPFVRADLAFGDALPVLMTEKDAVRCAAFADPRLWYVPVQARFSDADAHLILGRVLAHTGDAALARS